MFTIIFVQYNYYLVALKKTKRMYEYMFFLFLENEPIKDSYKLKKKITLELSPWSFTDVLQQWIENTNLKALRVDAIHFDMTTNIQILWRWVTSRLLLMGIPDQLMVDIIPLTMAFVLTTCSFVGKHAIWKGLDWECLFTNLLPSCRLGVLHDSKQIRIFFVVLIGIWLIHSNK
jgi:hypothetical protein